MPRDENDLLSIISRPFLLWLFLIGLTYVILYYIHSDLAPLYKPNVHIFAYINLLHVIGLVLWTTTLFFQRNSRYWRTCK